MRVDYFSSVLVPFAETEIHLRSTTTSHQTVTTRSARHTIVPGHDIFHGKKAGQDVAVVVVDQPVTLGLPHAIHPGYGNSPGLRQSTSSDKDYFFLSGSPAYFIALPIPRIRMDKLAHAQALYHQHEERR